MMVLRQKETPNDAAEMLAGGLLEVVPSKNRRKESSCGLFCFT